MSDEILDLDSLTPEPRKVKFGGEIIVVNPPKMGDIMAMGKFGRKMQDANPETTDYEPILEEMKTILTKLVPELEGKELNMNQILALSKLLSEMSNPDQTDSLVEVSAEEKKTP